MSIPHDWPTAMVVLASEQLWPNIHGLVHWHRQHGGLQDLFLYYTSAERESALPARRLKRLCEECYPEVTPQLPEQPLPIEPEGVRNQILRWKQQHPRKRWVINATGGLKLMFAGVLGFVGDEDTEVVYRELSGWFRLHRTGGVINAQKLTIAPEETDELNIEKLLRAHWAPTENIDCRCDRPVRLAVRRLTELGIEHGWAWKDVFRAAGLPSDQDSGKLFEQFVAAVLLELGVREAAINCTLETTGQQLQEIDVVVNHGGRLSVIDCKLTGEEDEKRGKVESVTSQIRQAHTTRRQLGGLGAQLMLLRPNREFSAEERHLAEDAYKLTVVDARDSWDLFVRLAQFLGSMGGLPDELQQAQELVRSTRGLRSRAFDREPEVVRRMTSGSHARAVLDLDAFLKQYRDETGQDWSCYRLHGEMWLRAVRPEAMDAKVFVRCVTNLVDSYASAEEPQLSNSEASFCVRVRGTLEEQAALRKCLEKRLGRSLL